MVRRNSDGPALVCDHEAAKCNSGEKHGGDHQAGQGIVSPSKISSPKLLGQKFPITLVHGKSPSQEMPKGKSRKAAIVPLCRLWVVFEKWSHKY
jgi:hypothetical protein